MVTSSLLSAKSSGKSKRRKAKHTHLSKAVSQSSGDEDEVSESEGESSDGTTNKSERSWPKQIRILYDNAGGIKVRQQTRVIKTIITKAIYNCEVQLISVHGFPENKKREDFRSDIAKDAMLSLRDSMKDNKYYQKAYFRAKKDPDFVHAIGEVVSTSPFSHVRCAYADQTGSTRP